MHTWGQTHNQPPSPLLLPLQVRALLTELNLPWLTHTSFFVQKCIMSGLYINWVNLVKNLLLYKPKITSCSWTVFLPLFKANPAELMFTLKQTKQKKKKSKVIKEETRRYFEGKELGANRLMERENNYCNPVKTYILLCISYDYILHSFEWAI